MSVLPGSHPLKPNCMDDVILFQYDGEIQALYQVTISPTLTNKKWGPKELPVKAGEQLDVIVKAEDNKLICRNEDGKCECLLPVSCLC